MGPLSRLALVGTMVPTYIPFNTIANWTRHDTHWYHHGYFVAPDNLADFVACRRSGHKARYGGRLTSPQGSGIRNGRWTQSEAGPLHADGE